MIFLAVVAELADLATYSPLEEQNPLVVGLGAAAPLAKLALVLLLVSIAALERRARPLARAGIRTALFAAIVLGAVGVWSNLA